MAWFVQHGRTTPKGPTLEVLVKKPISLEENMMRLFRTLAIALLAVAVLSQGALAQELRGRITGVVTDDSGAIVPGVTVTATSPALIQPQTTTSGSDGSYRFPALPSGLYTLTYELQGFQTVKREGVRVTLNQTFTLDAKMKPATLTEALTITADTPVVDTKTTSIGTAFTKELLTDIPNARDVWAAMAQAPGFQMTGYDVGGSHTGTQTGYLTYGVGDQNKTLIEGINVTESTNANAGYFDFGSFEEFQLGGAGNMGEQSGPGALLNITVKSGGNKFGGQAYFDYESDGTIADNVPDAFKTPGGVEGQFRAPAIIDPANRNGARLGLQRGNPITKQYDLNVNVGGPIIKEKLWFFAGYRDNNQYKTILGLAGTEAQSKLTNYTAKVTYQINPKNQLIGFFNSRNKLQPLRDLSLAVPLETAYYQASRNKPMKLEWTSVVNDRTFLNLQVSQWLNFFPLYPSETKSSDTTGVAVGRMDLSSSQRVGANNAYQDQKRHKPQFTGNISYVKDGWKGTHSFKFGVEVQRDRKEFLSFQPGNIFYRDNCPTGQSCSYTGNGALPALSQVDIWNTNGDGEGANNSINDAISNAAYLQDNWQINNRLSFNVGVRFDRYKLGWPEQGFTPAQSAYFQPVTTPATDVITMQMITPRVGFAWDVTGKGKTVVKAFFGRYAYNPSADITDNENPVGAQQRRYTFVSCAAGQTTGCDANGNRLLDGPNELGAFVQTVGGAGSVFTDRNLKLPYGDEISAHIEHELLPSLSVRGSYVMKQLRRGWAIVDANRALDYNASFTAVDPGPDGSANTADDKSITLLRRGSAAERRVYMNPESIGLPEYKGDYDTVEFAINRRLKDHWMLLTSFEQTWSEDFRDTASSTSALGVARQGTAYFWEPNRRRFGAQKTSFWNYKLLGRYEFPMGISAAASWKLQSGFQYARTISVNVPFGTGATTAAETIHAEPLNSNRSPNVSIIDLRAEKAFRFGGRKATLMVDVFNATNSHTPANFRVTTGRTTIALATPTSAAVTGPQFQELIALLDPRIIRFGVRLDF